MYKLKFNIKILQQNIFKFFIYASIFLSIILSFPGCAFNYMVKNIGKATVQLNPQKVHIESNGTLLIEAMLSKCPYNTNSKKIYKRFIVANQNVIEEAIKTAEESQKRHEDINHDYLNLYIPIESSDKRGAQLIPNHYKNINAEKSDLPKQFQEVKIINTDLSDLPEPFNYKINNETKYICISSFEIREGSPYAEEVKFWHYPAQILIVPAFAMDIIIFPIQFLVWLDMFIRTGGGG